MNEKLKIKIVSDGHPHNTRVMGIDENGEEYPIFEIQKVTIEADTHRIIAKLECFNPELDIVSETDHEI